MLWVTQFSSKLRKSSWIKAHHGNEKSRWGQGGEQGRACVRFAACAPASPSPASWKLLPACSTLYLLLLQHLKGPTETTGYSGGADWGGHSTNMAPLPPPNLSAGKDSCHAQRLLFAKWCAVPCSREHGLPRTCLELGRSWEKGGWVSFPFLHTCIDKISAKVIRTLKTIFTTLPMGKMLNGMSMCISIDLSCHIHVGTETPLLSAEDLLTERTGYFPELKLCFQFFCTIKYNLIFKSIYNYQRKKENHPPL